MNSTPRSDFDPVQLSAEDLIGTGTRRKCYQFPGRPQLCIKVPDRNKYGIKQQKREETIYRALARRDASMRCITRYFGRVETSLGPGYVYEAVRDPDGNYAQSFAALIGEGLGSAEDFVDIMNRLEDYLIDESVLFYDLNPSNVLCRRNDQGGFDPLIIDGLGDLVAIPVLNFSKKLRDQKIRRRWLRLVNRMRQDHTWMRDYRFRH